MEGSQGCGQLGQDGAILAPDEEVRSSPQRGTRLNATALAERLAGWRARIHRRRRVTLFARSMILMTCEVLFNALLWIIAALIFLRGPGDGHRILGLALVAWTTGLRHGLDADHISAIDNATRRIVSVPHRSAGGLRRPVTVGLFFSLGHSTIVVCTTVAIAVSANVADRLDGFGQVGGIIGASISSSFLILIGCINTVILYKTWQRLQTAKRAADPSGQQADGEASGGKGDASHFNGCLTRIAMPLLRSVDRPWKMYPVGVLFGLGFDTASSIALLSVATIAQQGSSSGGGSHNNANVVLLAFLFTAGMTLVDSADSCLMIWAYAPDLERKGRARFALWEQLDGQTPTQADTTGQMEKPAGAITPPATIKGDVESGRPSSMCNNKMESQDCNPSDDAVLASVQTQTSPVVRSLDASASRISLLLTLLSIVVAFCIGFIVLLGLIGDQCARCTAAADRQEQDGHDGGLEGRWWLTWRRANDNSGYVGAGIVGAFAVCVTTWFTVRAVRRRIAQKQGNSQA